DDGEWTEPERISIPARPGEEDVERVCKHDLRGDQGRGVVCLTPVPTPIEQHGRLCTRLDVVLLAQNDLERQGSPGAEHRRPQHGVPREQREPRTEHRPEEYGILSNGIEQADCSESQYERNREAKNAPR